MYRSLTKFSPSSVVILFCRTSLSSDCVRVITCLTPGGTPSVLLASITQVPVKLAFAAARTRLRQSVSVVRVTKVSLFIYVLLENCAAEQRLIEKHEHTVQPLYRSDRNSSRDCGMLCSIVDCLGLYSNAPH